MGDYLVMAGSVNKNNDLPTVKPHSFQEDILTTFDIFRVLDKKVKGLKKKKKKKTIFCYCHKF